MRLRRAVAALVCAWLYLGGGARGGLPTPPAWWQAQAACIHGGYDWHAGNVGGPIYVNGRRFWGESRDWRANTGNGYYGGFQFQDATWRSVGGHGLASDATPAEQTWRAWLVWKRDGGLWREWGTARACGLR